MDQSFDIVLYGTVDEVETLSKEQLSARDQQDGSTLLHYAVVRGDLKVLRLLLKMGMNPNEKDIVGRTPLHYAVIEKNEDMVLSLLNKGALYSIVDEFGKKPSDYTWERSITAIFDSFEYDSFDQIFQIRYGADIGQWIENEIRCMYIEVNDEYYDNLRVAEVGNKDEEDMYKQLKNNGCCGFEDRVVKCPINGKEYKLGMNFGH